MMRRLLALWGKEWLALSRDVLGLAVLFLMPAAFIVVMSLALSEVFKGGAARQAEFAVMAADPKLADRLARKLSGDGFRSAPAPADEAAARDGVRRGTPSLVLVVPRDFERALNAPLDGKSTQPQLTLLADPALPPTQLLAFRQRVLGVALALRVSAMMRRAGIAADADAFDLKRAAALSVETIGSSARPSSVQQNVPAWLIFGMFFVVIPISSLFVVERREGTLARLVSLRVPFSMLLLGKVGPYFVVNLAQAALMLLAGRTLVPWFGGETLALPARWDLLAAVTACTSLAAIGWGLLVAVCSRTLEQATVIGGVGNILAAAVGGIMVPRFVMPEAMQKLSEVSPMAWALDGFHAVILRGGGAADLAAPCVKLVALALALFAAALWVHHRRRVLTSAQ
ncbi:MAG: ABC transporter permease [Betaproteobacteria bacterium]|nr:MAG: ABC transporter permease [Betaproteobacteria bacterium]TMH74569.1 MAG: ABC transporter permease [Betaproteobacteria bacterium]